MSDDGVLDLDAAPRATTRRPRGPVWSRGRTAVVAAALLVALAVGLAAILWPRPVPEPEVLGLQDGPSEAWRWDASHDHPLHGTMLQGDRIATVMRMDQDDDATVHIRDAATGETVWQHNLGTIRPDAYVTLTDLPGTPWVSALLPGEAVLLDRETGEEHRRMPVPEFEIVEIPNHDGEPFTVPAGVVRVFSSDQGTVFTSVTRFEASTDEMGGLSLMEEQVELTAHHQDDLDTALWTVTRSLPPNGINFGEAEVIESDGWAFFGGFGHGVTMGGASDTRSYVFAVSLTDGQTPPWWPSVGGVSVVDGVALVAETGPVVAIDLQSGEELWRSDPGNWGTLTDGESLYLLPRSGGDLQRVDPRTGTVRWSVTVPISIEAGWDGTAPGTFWRGDPVVRQSRGSQGSTLVRFDSRTGREVMRLDLEVSPDDQQAYVGEDQLVILLTHERDRGEYLEMLTDRALGVDPDTGEIRWDQTFEGHVGVWGRHLAAMGADLAVTFYR